MLSDSDRHQLRKMIEAHGVEDQTEKIRLNKHSDEIRRCIQHIVALKENPPSTDKSIFEQEVLKGAGFLFFHYFDLYNLVLKQNDLTILHQLVDILGRIEAGELDQHEGSFLVGKLLKEIYIDNLIHDTKGEAPVPKRIPKEISWTEYKQMK
jgi:hypothetical protein